LTTFNLKNFYSTLLLFLKSDKIHNEKEILIVVKHKAGILWGITGLCLILTIVFWFWMNKVEVKYEEVTAVVTTTSSREVVNKNTHNRTTFYEVKVKYENKEYELKNVHGLAGYNKGTKVKALLANGKLYANIEGIKSTSPVAIIYFVFLFSTFGMVMASATYMSKVKNKKLENR